MVVAAVLFLRMTYDTSIFPLYLFRFVNRWNCATVTQHRADASSTARIVVIPTKVIPLLFQAAPVSSFNVCRRLNNSVFLLGSGDAQTECIASNEIGV